MKITTYQTDLQILPESEEEERKIIAFLTPRINSRILRCHSDVQGQEWYGKSFLEIPFRSDLKDELIHFMSLENEL